MRGKEITDHIVRGEIPDIEQSMEQLRAACANQEADGIYKNQNRKRNKFNFQRIARAALPAFIILAIFCIPIFQNTIPQVLVENPGIAEMPKSGNWFSLIAYATDTASDSDDETFVEITRDIAIKIPFYQAMDFMMVHYPSDSPIPVSFNYAVSMVYSNSGRKGFKVEGENIKSVKFESRNGSLIIEQSVEYYYDDGELFGVFYVPALFDTVYLEGEDLFDLRIQWFPYEFQETFEYEADEHEAEIYGYEVPLKGDKYIFKSDVITVSVTFDDGEVMAQIMEMTKDIYGYIYARIIG
jgi:hypothetical protein